MDPDKLKQLVAEARRVQQNREREYREKALKLFPRVCARCGREFEGQRLRELTVHHKDHNHDNNPPDGSNWELLCIYCHDNEHSRNLEQEWHNGNAREETAAPSLTHKPFAGLDILLKRKK
jgi:5-methylcytosine-specific restriction endonuclease McrA